MPATVKVVLSLDAIADLRQIRLYIQDKAGKAVADSYLARVQGFCRRFDKLPERGTLRDDIREGIRIAVFERSITIAYRFDGDRVTILRVLGRGRDAQSLLLSLE